MAVRTFEWQEGRARLLFEARSLAEASAGLPTGAYTSLRTYAANRVVRLSQHLRRLEESVALQSGPAPLDAGAARSLLAQALRASRHEESRVRLTFAPPRLFASLEPFEPLPEALYREGVACVTLPLRRENPHAKDTRFIATAARAYGSLPTGVHEGLLVGEDGSLLEGLSSNFFAVKDLALHTEEGRVLAGVTRALVLEVAVDVLPVRMTAVRKDDLGALGEAFLTSVSREVLPVVRVDDQVLGSGRPGAATSSIRERLADLVRREARPVE